MSNALSFEVKISRAAVERLLKGSNAKNMIIKGRYEYKGKKKGIHRWAMIAIAKAKKTSLKKL